ncbi:MAG: lytic transglycosylase domain-containing protein [Pseudomonadota bacterium]
MSVAALLRVIKVCSALTLAASAGAAIAAAQGGADRAPEQSLVARYDRSDDAAERWAVLPSMLSDEERALYRGIFQAIDSEDWQTAEQLLQQVRGGVLDQIALAEYFTHANSPRISADRIAQWFTMGTHLPQSEQLGRMGAKRGLEWLPDFPAAQQLRYQQGAAKRVRPRTVRDGTITDGARSAILGAIKDDDPLGAYETLVAIDPELSPEARAEWRQRVAWSFYIENDDQNALALAQRVAEGSGAWVAEGEWVAGLASWRLGNCTQSAEAFARAAGSSTNFELSSAAHYWAHRAQIRCGEPARAQDHLHAAAQWRDTLYGMLAADQLGLDPIPVTASQSSAFTQDDWRVLEARPNVRIAAALMEVGRVTLADEVLRHEARIGGSRGYKSLARLARHLGLPATQLFMAYHAPYGATADRALRYPVASWRPKTGWRVDPALAFAHALQESNFRASAVSPANARGLMQIRPVTAREHNRRLNLGASYADLNDPETNLAFGQRHLEMLRDSPVTQGKLPKIMAAYNAGLTPLARWNSEIRDFDDPLLWMESIPYWETRGYVAIVMRNYWMYQRAAGVPSPSRLALAQGLWPQFPETDGRQTARQTAGTQQAR